MKKPSSRSEIESLPLHLEKMLGEARMAVWRWDPEADVGTSSALMNELWGLKPGQNLQDSELGFALIHPDDVERQRALVMNAVANGGGWHNEFRILRPRDGKTAWLEERAYAVRHPETGKVTIDGVTWEVTARKEAELARRASDEKYRTLFDSIDEAFCLLELHLDASGKAVDFTYLETNPAFVRHSGMELQGKRVKDVLPGYDQAWLDRFAEALRTGEVVRFEHSVEGMPGQWFRMSAFRHGDPAKRRVAVIFANITEERKAAQVLRESEARGRFLVRLEDALRPLDRPDQIEATAARLLGEQLGADRVYYAEIHEAAGYAEIPPGYARGELPSIAARYPLSLFEEPLRPLRRGETLRIPDTWNEPDHPPATVEMFRAWGARSVLAAPLMKEERLRWALTVLHGEPRDWSDWEIALVRETAERTWAAVGRALAEENLRASEEKYHSLFDSIDEGFALIEVLFDAAGNPVDLFYHETNPAFARHAGIEMQGRRVKDAIPDYEPFWIDTYGRVARTGEPVRGEHSVRGLDDNWFRFAAFRHGSAADNRVGVVFANITETKKAEQTRAEFQMRLEMQVRERTAALRESRDLLQSVFDTTLLGISYMEAVRDDQGRVVDFVIRLVNKELERETGRDDLPGRYYSLEFPGIRASGLFDVMLRVLETGVSEGMEYHYPHDGFDKWFSSMFVKFEDGLVATNLDVTAQKQGEIALKNTLSTLELENKIHAYAEEIALMGTWTWNTATDKLTYSENLYRLFGLEPMETPPSLSEITRFIHPDDQERVRESSRELVRSGQRPHPLEYRVIRKDGVIRHFANRVQKVSDVDGGHLLVGITEDITDRKRAEERTRRLRLERLQSEERTRLALLAATLNTQEAERKRIAESLHNGIGQMLYGIQLNLNQLDLKPGDVWTPRHGEQKARTTQLLGEAINESRRVSHELMPSVLEDFGLRVAMDDICKQFHGKLNIDCKYSGLPDSIPKYVSIALYRALQELMTNVVKHAEAGSVRVHLRHTGDAFELEVVDDGLGFDASKKMGGIGLKSLREKIELLKGEFHLDSGEKGTSIRVRLPDVDLDEG